MSAVNLAALSEGPLVGILQWVYHTLSKDQVQVLYDSVHNELEEWGVTFGEAECLGSLCPRLHELCLSQCLLASGPNPEEEGEVEYLCRRADGSMRDENEILQIKEGRLREAVREAATIEFLLNDKNECPGVINGVCDDTTRDLSEAVEHMDAKQDANDEEFNQDAPIPDLPTYVSQLKELAVGPILPLLHWAFYTLDEGLVAAVQESVECEWGGLKEISFSEDDLISLICEALHSHCSSNGDAGQVPQHLKTREDGRARSKKEEMSILSGQLREAVEEAATHEHMLEASYLGGSELGGEEDETDPSFLLWLAENEEAGGGVGRHSKCDSSSPSPPIPFPPESPLPCSSLEGYLQKLNSLAEGPVLPLLIWGFHTLPKDLVESVYEGLEIELGNKGFEENFFLQLACINLQNSVLECHQQHQLFCAGGASGTPSGVSLKAGGGGSHAHVLRRGDGRVRGEDECLAVFNGDLRRAAHAALRWRLFPPLLLGGIPHHFLEGFRRQFPFYPRNPFGQIQYARNENRSA